MGTDVTAAVGQFATWRDDLAVVLLGCAAALFIVAGVVRLARWRVAGDPHSALAGCALIVMGALYLPLVGIAEVSGALQRRPFGEALIRLIATAAMVGLLVQAVRITTIGRFIRPTRVLPALAAVVLGGFAAIAAMEATMPNPMPEGRPLAQVLSLGMVLAWIALAVAVRRLDPDRPWARRATPLFGAMALAEALHGMDPGNAVANGASLVVCTIVAGFGVRSAHLDLEAALALTDRTIGSLSETLRETIDEAAELSQWRARLLHDADNSVAGLRAALDVLDTRRAMLDPRSAGLCHAATEEVRHLDHLLHRTPDEPRGPFDVGAVVRSVAVTARALGQDLTLHECHAVAVGRPGDLVTVLKNLLVNASRHAPGAHVDLSVVEDSGRIRIICSDTGPGLTEAGAARAFDLGYRGPASTGSGLGLHEARLLMRGQGGDLVLEDTPAGARFVASLPMATSPAPQRVAGIPMQRRGGTLMQPARVTGDGAR